MSDDDAIREAMSDYEALRARLARLMALGRAARDYTTRLAIEPEERGQRWLSFGEAIADCERHGDLEDAQA